MKLYAIQHIPTKNYYTPNHQGQFRNGRNWRKNKAVLFTDYGDAAQELFFVFQEHLNGNTLRIRNYGGFDASRPEDAVGDGFIRQRDFRIVEMN